MNYGDHQVARERLVRQSLVVVVMTLGQCEAFEPVQPNESIEEGWSRGGVPSMEGCINDAPRGESNGNGRVGATEENGALDPTNLRSHAGQAKSKGHLGAGGCSGIVGRDDSWCVFDSVGGGHPGGPTRSSFMKA